MAQIFTYFLAIQYVGAGQYESKFLSTISTDNILISQVNSKKFSQFFYHKLTGWMTIRVIYFFKKVNVGGEFNLYCIDYSSYLKQWIARFAPATCCM